MIFHKNCLLADDSHEISYLIFFKNLKRCHKTLSSAAVVIGTLIVLIRLCALVACIAHNTYPDQTAPSGFIVFASKVKIFCS